MTSDPKLLNRLHKLADVSIALRGVANGAASMQPAPGPEADLAAAAIELVACGEAYLATLGPNA
jgi:hypothetical protein